MNVAPAKPKSPRTDGAAIGCRKTRGRAKSPYQPSVSCVERDPCRGALPPFVDRAHATSPSYLRSVTHASSRRLENRLETSRFIRSRRGAERDRAAWGSRSSSPPGRSSGSSARATRSALGPAAQSPRSQDADAADRRGRPRRAVDLPVLRGRLRPARLRQGRRGHAHRGRSRRARSRAGASARRGRRRRASCRARCASTRSSTGGRTAPRGRSSSLDEAMEMIADRDRRDARRDVARTRPRTARPRTARWRSATSAARRSTTRRTT